MTFLRSTSRLGLVGLLNLVAIAGTTALPGCAAPGGDDAATAEDPVTALGRASALLCSAPLASPDGAFLVYDECVAGAPRQIVRVTIATGARDVLETLAASDRVVTLKAATDHFFYAIAHNVKSDRLSSTFDALDVTLTSWAPGATRSENIPVAPNASLSSATYLADRALVTPGGTHFVYFTPRGAGSTVPTRATVIPTAAGGAIESVEVGTLRDGPVRASGQRILLSSDTLLDLSGAKPKVVPVDLGLVTPATPCGSLTPMGWTSNDLVRSSVRPEFDGTNVIGVRGNSDGAALVLRNVTTNVERILDQGTDTTKYGCIAGDGERIVFRKQESVPGAQTTVHLATNAGAAAKQIDAYSAITPELDTGSMIPAIAMRRGARYALAATQTSARGLAVSILDLTGASPPKSVDAAARVAILGPTVGTTAHVLIESSAKVESVVAVDLQTGLPQATPLSAAKYRGLDIAGDGAVLRLLACTDGGRRGFSLERSLGATSTAGACTLDPTTGEFTVAKTWRLGTTSTMLVDASFRDGAASSRHAFLFKP